MKLGVAIEDTWDFFHEIYAEFRAYHDVTLFQRRRIKSPVFHARINRYLFNRDLKRLMMQNDLVFFEWSSHLLAAASHMAKTCKIVTRLHRFELNEWADRVNWENVDLLIVVAEAKKQEVLARFPQLKDKVEVVAGAVDSEKFSLIRKTYNGDIGILCHLTPRKRVYELILTFYDLLKTHPHLHLHIGGGRHVAYRDYHDALHDTVSRLNMQENVTFYGHVDEPKDWYKNVDVIISNGYSEGLQVSPLEAMSTGRLVFSHFWRGADEMLPKEYLYFTNGQLAELLIEYDSASIDQKESQSKWMRDRVITLFNIQSKKVEVRKLVESVAAGSYYPSSPIQTTGNYESRISVAN
ncbi:MAG: glycosyltransferase family 4 protein [Chloroflexota bacterium]